MCNDLPKTKINYVLDTTTVAGKKAFKAQIAREWAEFMLKKVYLPKNDDGTVDLNIPHEYCATYGGKFLSEWTVKDLIKIYNELGDRPAVKPYILRRNGKSWLVNEIINITIENHVPLIKV